MRIGIDPGLTGAIGLITNAGQYQNVWDMPVMPYGKSKNQVDGKAVANLFETLKCSYEIDRVILEHVHCHPNNGAVGMFNFGMGYGLVQGVISTVFNTHSLVTPQRWKGAAGLIGTEKYSALALARELFPDAPLTRKKDIGRADALLIARFSDVRN